MRADWIKLMIAAARLPLRSDPANNQVERPCPWPYLIFDRVMALRVIVSDQNADTIALNAGVRKVTSPDAYLIRQAHKDVRQTGIWILPLE